MSNQEIVRQLINQNIKLHTVNGVQCVRYRAIRGFLHPSVRVRLDGKTTVSFPYAYRSKKATIMWDNIKRVKYIRLDWVLDTWRNKKSEVFVGV